MIDGGWILPLFVPATRPDRFATAAGSGADAFVVDLEDAVATSDKDAARANIPGSGSYLADLILRVNAVGTPWHDADCAAAKQSSAVAVMLPKVEAAHDVERVAMLTGLPVIALIESVEGVARVAGIAAAAGTVQLGLGTQDLAAQLGCRPASRLFDALRWEMVFRSCASEIAPPIDGVSLDLSDQGALEADGRALADMGFAGKFCIHPTQIAPLRRGLLPGAGDVERARLIASSPEGASRVGDIMVDAPIRRQAERLLDRYRRLSLPAGDGSDRHRFVDQSANDTKAA